MVSIPAVPGPSAVAGGSFACGRPLPPASPIKGCLQATYTPVPSPAHVALARLQEVFGLRHLLLLCLNSEREPGLGEMQQRVGAVAGTWNRVAGKLAGDSARLAPVLPSVCAGTVLGGHRAESGSALRPLMPHGWFPEGLSGGRALPSASKVCCRSSKPFPSPSSSRGVPFLS